MNSIKSKYKLIVIGLAILFICFFVSCETKFIPQYLGIEMIEETSTQMKKMNFSRLSDETVDYHAKKNEEIIIAAHFLNPDSFEILSFNINGIKYQAYQFLEESTSEIIYVTYNVGEETGDLELFIDEIKYVDGTNIVNMSIYGEQSIIIRVGYDTLPWVSISENVTCTSITLNITINDYEGFEDKPFVFTLYNSTLINKEVIITKSIEEKESIIVIDNLDNTYRYHYEIIALFDPLLNEKKDSFILYENDLILNEYINKEEYSSEVDTVSYNIDMKEGKITKVILSYNDQEISSSEKNSDTFIGLMYNTLYTLEIHYSILDKTLILKREIKTKECNSVLFDVSTGVKQKEITYQLTYSNNIKSYKVTLKNSDDEIVELYTDTGVFSDLKSGESYKLIIDYQYEIGIDNYLETKQKIITIKTLTSDIKVTSFQEISQRQVEKGFVVRFRLNLDNEQNYIIKDYYYNDNKFSVILTDNQSYAVLEMILFDVEQNVYVSNIDYYNGQIVKYELNDPISVKVTLHRIASIINVYTDKKYFEWMFFYVYVEVDGPLDKICNFEIFGSDSTGIKSNPNIILSSINYENQNNIYKVTFDTVGIYKKSIINLYRVDVTFYDKETISILDLDIMIYRLNDINPKEINNSRELMNIRDGYTYNLNCDLDMKDILWEPKNFYGIIHGNNHTINNLTISISTEDRTKQCYGMFSYFSGIIDNLKLNNINYNIKYNFMETEWDYVKVGGLIGCDKGNIYLDNIEITGNIKYSSTQYNFCGGVIGYIENSREVSLSRIKTNVSIYCDNSKSHSINAGVIGYCMSFQSAVTLNNILIISNIETSSTIGSLASGIINIGFIKSIVINKGLVKTETININYITDFVCNVSNNFTSINRFNAYAHSGDIHDFLCMSTNPTRLYK